MGLKNALKALFADEKPKEHVPYEFTNEDRGMSATMKALNRQIQRKQKLMEIREMKRTLDAMDDDDDENDDEEEDEEPRDSFQEFISMMAAQTQAAQPAPINPGIPTIAATPPPSPVAPNPLIVSAIEKQMPYELRKWLESMNEEDAVALIRAVHQRLKSPKA